MLSYIVFPGETSPDDLFSFFSSLLFAPSKPFLSCTESAMSRLRDAWGPSVLALKLEHAPQSPGGVAETQPAYHHPYNLHRGLTTGDIVAGTLRLQCVNVFGNVHTENVS